MNLEKIYHFKLFVVLILLACFSGSVASAKGDDSPLQEFDNKSFDLIVVGASPAGISCAVRAAREGLNVLLVERTKHVGGFLASGCGGWEAPYDGIRSPIYGEIREMITSYYKKRYGEGSPQHLSSIPNPEGNRHIDRAKVEPKVAESLFNEMIIRERNLKLVLGYYPIYVERNKDFIWSVTFQEFNGKRKVKVYSQTFADCTYEADLAALTGVPYKVGRESRGEYNEPHAGVVYTKSMVKKNSPKRFSTDAVEGRLKIRTFPGLMCKEEILPGSSGEGDNSVMAYNYRLILSSDKNNQRAIKKPKGYDSSQFVGFDGGRVVPNIPNNKVGYNSGRIVGPQVFYPEGDWHIRDSISQIYLNYALQQLYYLQNDAPDEIRQRWTDYGLAKDEFVDNDNIPYEIYVREARRIVGKYVFTENDNIPDVIERTKIHSDAIAITDWPVDHVASVNRSVPGGNLDGIMFLSESSRPAQIPYRSLVPQGIKNLLVPLCLSASHVGWGSIRLEPVWMGTGEASGYAAALSKFENAPPSELDADLLVKKLVENKFVVSMFNDILPGNNKPWNEAVQYFGTKGFFRGYDAFPENGMDKETLAIWIDLFNRLLKDEAYNETFEASRLPGIDKLNPGNSVSKSTFVNILIENTSIGRKDIEAMFKLCLTEQAPGNSISRGEVCVLLYNLLDETNM